MATVQALAETGETAGHRLIPMATLSVRDPHDTSSVLGRIVPFMGCTVSDVLPRDGDIVELVRERAPDGVDALLDVVNYAPGTYDRALKDGARVASPTGAAGEGPGRTMVMAAPSPENLQRLGALLAAETLRIPVQASYELAQAPEALSALTGQHTQGKLAIRIG